MELRQLAHFVAIAEELHFTRAAARVHVVQSSLSASATQQLIGLTLSISAVDRGALVPEVQQEPQLDTRIRDRDADALSELASSLVLADRAHHDNLSELLTGQDRSCAVPAGEIPAPYGLVVPRIKVSQRK